MFDPLAVTRIAEDLPDSRWVIGLPAPRSESFPHRNASGTKGDADPQVLATLHAPYARFNAGLAELLRTDQFVTIDPALWPEWIGRQHW